MVKINFHNSVAHYGAEPGGGAPTKVNITFIDSHGQSRVVAGEVGSTVMETARRNDIPEIAAECGEPARVRPAMSMLMKNGQKRLASPLKWKRTCWTSHLTFNQIPDFVAKLPFGQN